MGAIVASILILGQAGAMGGIGGILQVADTSPLLPVIEAELGEIRTDPVHGHDSQLYYGVGLDPTGEYVPELIDNASYRYRRILYPLVASLFGLVGGHALLWGMVVLTILSTGFASGAVGYLARRYRRSDWLALVVVLNPGVWLGVRLITTEPMAIALMLAGLWMFLERRRGVTLIFTLMGLTREMFLITPAGLAVDRPAKRWRLIAIPALALVAWMVWVDWRMGDGFGGGGNIGLPFQGISEAIVTWGSVGIRDLLYLAFALVSVAVGLLYSVLVKSWLRWSILGWALLGIVSTHFVWDIGNNAARGFAPIVILIALAELGRTSGDGSGRLPAEVERSAD